MSEDQRPGAPGPAADGPGDDDVVPHPFGTGAAGGPGRAPRPDARRPAAAEDGRRRGRSAEPAAAPRPAAAPGAGPGAPEQTAPGRRTARASRSRRRRPASRRPRRRRPRRRRRRDPMAAVLIGVLTLLLGFAFAVQVRTADDDSQLSGAREEDLVRILDELDAQEERLRDQLAEQRSALEQLTNSDSRAATALEAARQRAEAIGILNGTIAAQGPGLRDGHPRPGGRGPRGRPARRHPGAARRRRGDDADRRRPGRGLDGGDRRSRAT